MTNVSNEITGKMQDAAIDAALEGFIQSIVGCARCDAEGHENLRFKRMEHPVLLDKGQGADATAIVAYTHWASCPTNGDPILMRIFKSYPEDEQAVTKQIEAESEQ